MDSVPDLSDSDSPTLGDHKVAAVDLSLQNTHDLINKHFTREYDIHYNLLLQPMLANEDDPLHDFKWPEDSTKSPQPDAVDESEDPETAMDEDYLSIDYDHEALFGSITLKDLTDEELNSAHDTSLSQRRENLIIATALINGCLTRVMLDSGFTGSLMISPESAERCGIKPHRDPETNFVLSTNIVVGDGRTVQSQVATSVKIDLGGYSSLHDALIMPLGTKFDAVIGYKFFEDLQHKCQSPLSWDFIKQQVSFKVNDRKYTISAHEVPAHMFMAPTSCTAYLNAMMHKSVIGESLPSGTRIIRVTDDMQLIRTNEGDDYILHEPISASGTDTDSPKTVEPDFSTRSAFGGGEKEVFQFHSSTNDDDDDDLDGSRLVAKAILDQDKENLVIPETNPNWMPEVPADSETYEDADFMERIDKRENTMEKLQELETKVGVKFIDSVLKRNGQVFRDEVPCKMVPDRGPWNGSLDFVDKTDADRPICKKPYRLSPDETKAAAQNIRDLLLKGIVRPSKSPWGTPIFLVPKSDGGWRMACDYRDLNAKLIKEAYSLPAADQLFDQLGDAKYFSSHDCTWGYHQLRWSPDSIPRTAIRTHLGTFEFLVVNFGSTSAPAQYTRLMEAILRPYLGRFVVIFLDDMCVFSNTPEEHAKHLNLVYRLLAKNKIFLKFGKCFFFTTKFKFLGWVIFDGKLTPGPAKIATLQDWPHPTSKSEARSFTGFCIFYKRFVSGYAKRISPLHDL